MIKTHELFYLLLKDFYSPLTPSQQAMFQILLIIYNKSYSLSAYSGFVLNALYTLYLFLREVLPTCNTINAFPMWAQMLKLLSKVDKFI